MLVKEAKSVFVIVLVKDEAFVDVMEADLVSVSDRVIVKEATEFVTTVPVNVDEGDDDTVTECVRPTVTVRERDVDVE